MSMSTHITAFIPDTDKDYQRHKKVFLACQEAGVSLPPETAKYFGSTSGEPENYFLDEKLTVAMKEGVHYVNWSDESSVGFEVDITKLPSGVTKLRFSNSW